MGSDLYQGKEGGLYPQGNTPRDDFQAASIEMAKRIQPLDNEGNPDAENGRIVLLSIGMSLTSMEFGAFQNLAASDPLKNPKVSIIDGAFPGVGAASVANRETDIYWNGVGRRLNMSELDSKQVQVVWLKEVNGPQRGFPKDAEKLEEDLKTIVQILKERYVNLHIIYLSSRSYGGYSAIGLNPEPYAYETGFAVKWLIQAQMNGDPDLNYDESKGVVTAPLLRWGPYLWADGANARKDNNLNWQCSDFSDDGLHPSSSGMMKIAKLLLNFMQTDPTARIWYLTEDAQNQTIDPLVFASSFPTLWQMVLIIIGLGGVFVVIRFARNRRQVEEEYE